MNTKAKLIGGILLITGTSIGGGMLALPLATAAGGYLHSLWIFLGAWIITVIGAFLILEVNLWLPEDTNLVSMAKNTIGQIGEIITWVTYLLLLYSLLAAYTSGGTDLLRSIFKAMHIQTPNWFDSLLFILLLGSIVFHGIKSVDWANRGLMTIKLSAYLLLVILILPKIDFTRLFDGKMHLLAGAVLVVLTSFGYATIIPSLRSYFKSDVKSLRIAIAVGSLIPLLCYLLWDLAVQGTINAQGKNGLINIALSQHAITYLTTTLSNKLNNTLVTDTAHLFTYICITTSFLGVALCLSDFLADGLQIKKVGKGKWTVAAVTFLPPLIIVIFFPGAFIIGLGFAGIFCVILLMLLPAIMAWWGRYVKKISHGYQMWGGRGLLILEMIASFALLIYGFVQLIK